MLKIIRKGENKIYVPENKLTDEVSRTASKYKSRVDRKTVASQMVVFPNT